MELISIVVSALVDFYNATDWSQASDFMSFLNETLTFVVGLQSQRTDKEKDDHGSPKP